MAFAIGDEVLVTRLGKRGRVIEAAAGGRYRVLVGALATWCTESELERVGSATKKGRRGRASEASGSTGAEVADRLAREASERQRNALRSIDLHGLTVEEALRAVEARLDAAIRAGLDRLEIIHGISGGRLRAAVRGYLARIGSVRRVEPDPNNAGVTWVYF